MIMAAPAPTNLYRDWSMDARRSVMEKKASDESLEVGMSNLTMLHTTRHQRQATESTMSSSPVGEDITARSAGSAPPSPTVGAKQFGPSPISKPPSLTLTPNSSDGGGVFMSAASPFNGSSSEPGPSLPFLKQHRRGTSSNFGSTGSFDLPSEPPVEQSPRHRSRDLPPLSQSYMEMHYSTSALDQQTHAYGAIGSDAGRRRASSHETLPLPPDPHFKFGNPPPAGFANMDRPRHMRSVSQPGTAGLYEAAAQYRAATRSSSFYEPPQTSRSASSSPNLGQYYGNAYPRDALDNFYPGTSYSGSIDSYASQTPGSVSPVGHHSPHTVHYGSYPMRYAEADELVGENIEVPEQHEDLPYYGLQNLRGHGHSLSMDGAYGATAPAARRNIYAVKFKRSQRNFVLGSRINRELKIGTYVKVEADRGEDLGIVVGRPEKTYVRDGPKRILRLATHDEVSLLRLKREEEDELLSICRQKVVQRGLPMNVVDAEYQFDRHKLTFFFEAEGRVDFRELVRDLFSMYKTRIWMQQLDKSTSAFAPAMVAPMTDVPLDFGNPIIAPLSEFVDSIYPNVQS